MARPRASDHDTKRGAILARSAELIARHGYDRASISMIAAACGVSKALVYHYYRDKEALLDDIIRTHLERLVETVRAADVPDAPPEERLGILVAALLDAYRNADAWHQVQINHLSLLPAPRQKALKALERALVDRFAAALIAASPALRRDARLVKPATMSLFGMLNWHYLWFRPGGALSRADYAALATRIILDGTRALALPVPPLAQTAS
jgi:TetR/AcrR family transcriptional regulator